MVKCIKSNDECIGRDCRELIMVGSKAICCKEEINDEIEIVQNIIDTIDDYAKDIKKLYKVSSKLSYAAHVINNRGDEDLCEILNIAKRFSMLLHEFQEKIVNDYTISDLALSFTNELQKWFSQHFLKESNIFSDDINLPSIIADMSTLEMALGVCMIDHSSECLDDLFF